MVWHDSLSLRVAAVGSEMPAGGTGPHVTHCWLSGTPGPTGFAGKLSPSSYPLADVFAESFSRCLFFFSPLLLLMGKAVKPENSLPQISIGHVEAMPQPTPADAASKLYWDQRLVLKNHFCQVCRVKTSSPLLSHLKSFCCTADGKQKVFSCIVINASKYG